MDKIMKQSKALGLFIIAAIYAIAIAIGVYVFWALPDLHIFWRILIGDVAATVFVYITGVLLKNVSVYDPYWSVAPIAVLTALVIESGVWNMGIAVLLIAVWYWGVRLTCNWAYTFKNLATQDWRYDHFKERFPRIFQLISFAGLNMFPTAVVFLCLLPGIVFVEQSSFNAITLIGLAICVFAATLQLIADIQMQKFRKKNAGTGEIIRFGLWKHSRHPNYLGEILMWWGVYVIMLSALPEMWYLGAGALVNTLMFLFVSIPLADKRNRKIREGFDDYMRQTNSLLPLKIKRSES
jgi:steroid 5-alpha reductase family enzyme